MKYTERYRYLPITSVKSYRYYRYRLPVGQKKNLNGIETNSYLSYEYNKTVVLLPVCGGRKNFGSRGFFSRSRLPNFADRDSEKKRVYAFFSESSRSANFASRAC